MVLSTVVKVFILVWSGKVGGPGGQNGQGGQDGDGGQSSQGDQGGQSGWLDDFLGQDVKVGQIIHISLWSGWSG